MRKPSFVAGVLFLLIGLGGFLLGDSALNFLSGNSIFKGSILQASSIPYVGTLGVQGLLFGLLSLAGLVLFVNGLRPNQTGPVSSAQGSTVLEASANITPGDSGRNPLPSISVPRPSVQQPPRNIQPPPRPPPTRPNKPNVQPVPASPSPRPPVQQGPSLGPSPLGQRVLQETTKPKWLTYTGGKKTPERPYQIDCSHFVWEIHRDSDLGYTYEKTTAFIKRPPPQFEEITDRRQVRPGDVVVMRGKTDHMGFYSSTDEQGVDWILSSTDHGVRSAPITWFGPKEVHYYRYQSKMP